MRIRILPEDIANKIAAGEVVERPASAVKELIENSIDAESRNIDVEIQQGGKKLIQVTDDGIGMSKEDALLAVRRHATSKISSVDDLSTIMTLGFRGEALPSIGSVSRMELITRTADDDVGTKIIVEGGKLREPEEIGCPVGTRVKVSNLFFNVPARAKFLKSETSEFRQILNVVTWCSLANPGVSIRLSHNGRTVIDVPAVKTYRDRIYSIYGRNFMDSLIEITESTPQMDFRAYIGNPEFNKPNRTYQLFFLNGRPIRSNALGAALAQAMNSLIPKGRHAVAFLFLQMDPRDIDVNVHPAKLEVRFRDERRVFSQIVSIINKGVHSGAFIPTMSSAETGEFHQAESVSSMKVGDVPSPRQTEFNMEGQRLTAAYPARSFTVKRSPLPEEPENKPTEENEEKPVKESRELGGMRLDHLNITGVLFNTYILLESGDEVLIVDQHAASERVMFEKLIKQFNDNGIQVQGLLMPMPVDLPTNLMETLTEYQELMTRLGFDIDRFGGNTILVRAVPVALKNSQIEGAVIELLEQFSSDKNNPSMPQVIEQSLITLACRTAVKAGDKLSRDEIQTLLHDLGSSGLPFNCPHSRPTIIRMTRDELEMKFRRK